MSKGAKVSKGAKMSKGAKVNVRSGFVFCTNRGVAGGEGMPWFWMNRKEVIGMFADIVQWGDTSVCSYMAPSLRREIEKVR